MMKKIVITFLIISEIITSFSCQNKGEISEEVLSGNFCFKISIDNENRGILYYDNKDLEISNPTDNGMQSWLIKSEINNNSISFQFKSAQYEICGNNDIWKNWSYPLGYQVNLFYGDIKKILKHMNEPIVYSLKIKEYTDFRPVCNALIITDNLRVRSEPNLAASTKIIAKFNKWDDVHLIDCTKEKTKIDGLEYPWYKVQLENGQEGWIFGGFAKIYFSARDKDYLYKAFEKEGSEYTNQFVTPEEFY